MQIDVLFTILVFKILIRLYYLSIIYPGTGTGWGVVEDSALCAVTANAVSSRKHRMVGSDQELRSWSDRAESDQPLAHVVPFDSMYMLVRPDWTRSESWSC